MITSESHTARDSVSQVILLDKPCGVSSFRVLDAVKRALGTKKVGHTGTLDPFARGLMIVLTGRYTRLASIFSGLDKEYRAVFRFGEETDTLDTEGSVVRTAPVPSIQQIREAAVGLTGELLQKPPAYSAKRIGGQRAHRLARAGHALDLEGQVVTVSQIEIESFAPPDLRVRVACSKGTYIRSLARDLGQAAGSCAYVSALERTRVGPFSVEAAVAPEEIDRLSGSIAAYDALTALRFISIRSIAESQSRAVCLGKQVNDTWFEAPPVDGLVGLFDADRTLVAVCRRSAGTYRYVAVVGRND